jgi:hypothetical protein
VALAGCDSTPSVPTGATTPTPTTPSPSVVFFIYCDHHLPQVGKLLDSIRQGTQPPHDLMLALVTSQETVEAEAAATDPITRKAFSEVADALGLLNLAIADAGTDYPSNPVVDLRLQSAWGTMLSATRASCLLAPGA